jgi:hypothetical protein
MEFRKGISGKVIALSSLLNSLLNEIIPSLPADGIRQTDKQI